MRLSKLGILAGMVLFALPGAMWGQGIEERVTNLEKQAEEQRKGLAGALGIDMHAMVDTMYTYSFNNPDSDFIEYRVFDTDHNSISLNQANLYFGRQKEDENWGFATNLDFGKTAEVVGFVTCWNSDCDSSEQDNSFELREAYATYKIPIEMAWGGNVSFKGGKFVTLLGYEVIKSYNAFNFNSSNSIMFGWAIPFTHTGLLMNVPFGDMLSVDLGVVNGWDAVVDNNDSKTLLAGIKLVPAEMFTTYIAGTYGAEQTDNGKSKRAMVTVGMTLVPTDWLTLAADLNWANESDIELAFDDEGTAFIARSGSDADWYGGAAYAVFTATDKLSFALRGELFDDPDGVRSFFQADGFGPGVTVWEATATMAFKLTEGLLTRLEYRHDEADKPFFGKDDDFQSGSDTLSIEFLYAL